MSGIVTDRLRVKSRTYVYVYDPFKRIMSIFSV